MYFRNTIKTLAAAVLVATVAVSCGGDEPDEPVVPAGLTTSDTSLGASSGSAFLSVTAGKDWSISLSFSDGGNWASVTPPSGTGSRNSVILSYEANAGTEPRSVTLTLTATPGGSANLVMTQSGTGSATPETPQYGYGYDVAGPKWLELPATKAGDGKEWFAHDMTGGDFFTKGGIRNWSFYYDYGSYLASWVAYPLNKGLMGSGSRTNSWGADALLPYTSQQSLDKYFVFNEGGETWYRYYSDLLYDRGHQIPSADRLDRQSNVSTFYYTNMTPQHKDFNSDIWADLENRVRGYASSSDTLYVVTGCSVEADAVKVNDRAGHEIPVPSAYYKALLRYMPGSTYGDYMACGFFLPHDGSIAKGNYLDYIMSVSELEKKTGMEFFVNLPSVVGSETAAKIKDQEPVSWWK